ncbi:hypothetical protein [Kribbella kalugense]|uniref:hypothetical protein n=1 Tax=Kribbella kalugense TaxID=2512221 RepID=UPI0010650924|nr:hypothetical protein [Kribbella kalugense]
MSPLRWSAWTWRPSQVDQSATPLLVHHPDRLNSEEKLRKGFPGSTVADAALDYGASRDTVDVTTKGIQAATVASSSDYAATTDLATASAKPDNQW